MVGTLPSVTPVGMAALLPHRRLEMDDSLKIRCDGRGTEAPDREAVLRAACAESTALDYAAFRQCSKAQRGELVKGRKVVYIYHDTIDQTGEGGGSAGRPAKPPVSELTQLMRSRKRAERRKRADYLGPWLSLYPLPAGRIR